MNDIKLIEAKKEYEKKDCLDCHYLFNGVCDAYNKKIEKPVLISQCSFGVLRIKGN